MTDSDSEISNSNVFTFQNVNTTVSARGPNTNISNFSFRNQMTSTMCLPRNFERRRYAESVSDQRSIYYRRETSPMSIHSACDIRPRNFQQYHNGMGSQKSVFNGRSGSPMSIRSIDSSASVSAADIAFAFKNVKFNKYDLKVIKEAYQKLMKQRIRKRIEKRRNMRLFLKGSRNRSGDDSGEQGSDSSISSDDCRSIKTSYKENMSTRMDLAEFKKSITDNNMLKDSTDTFRQNKFKNIFSVGASSNRQPNLNFSSVSQQSFSAPTQKNRFKNGFVLPSQRFNRSVASTVIPESTERFNNNKENNVKQSGKCLANRICESGSDEEIFAAVSVREKSIHNPQVQGKRSLDSDDASLPDKKRSKTSSPKKNTQYIKEPPKSKSTDIIMNNAENSNNFEFAKPTLPVRKSRPKVQEKVIAKSRQPLGGFVEPTAVNNTENVQSISTPEKPIAPETQIEQCELSQNSDVSMRPSFIKRKLFTQKLDVAEKANLSSDAVNSPQNVYSALQKEKNKARKLVTTQSCMNREVQDDNNLLDLIHKIVPPDRMNVTNQTSINQTKTDVNKSNKNDADDDRWDVTSVLSMCNENDVSDTFTDEEIFQSDDKKKRTLKKKENNCKTNINSKSNTNTTIKSQKKINENHSLPHECRILIEKMPNNCDLHKIADIKSINLNHTNVNKSVAKNSAKTFWDTDFESDVESQVTTHRSNIKENQNKGTISADVSNREFKQPLPIERSPIAKSHTKLPETSRWLNNTKINNTSVMNNTLDSTKKVNISTLSVRSHRTTKRKKCCNETCSQDISFKPSNKPKNAPITESIDKTSSLERNNNNVSKPVNNVKSTSKRETTVKKAPQASINCKNTNTKKSPASNQPNKNVVTKSTKITPDNKPKSTATTKSKSSKQKANTSITRSASRTRKSPTATKSKTLKPKDNSKDLTNLQSLQDRPIRSCRTPSLNRSLENSRSSRQFNISPLNVIKHPSSKKKNDDTSFQDLTSKTEIKPKSDLPEAKKKSAGKSNMKTEVKKTSKNQSVSAIRIRKSPKKNKSKAGKEVIHYQTPKSDRPIRLCRTPGHNMSIENYKSLKRR